LDVFYHLISTVYYLPGTTGWGSTFGGLPTALWRPLVETSGADLGVRTNQFGLNIAWASGQTVVVEACTNLANPIWSPVKTNTLSDGSSYFSDPQWTNYIRRFYRVVGFATNSAPPVGMVLIPAGSFTMGNCMSPSEGGSDELPLHTVYVSGFYMDRYEVTKALWDEVYQWAITHGYTFDYAGSGKASTHPVQSIDWYDCVKWCNARSEKEGRVPAYYNSAAQTTPYRTGQINVQTSWVNWNSGYRLPTEAEWEKAARGGASGHRFPWSDVDTIDWSRANYYSLWSGGVPFYPYDVNSTSGGNPAGGSGGWPYTSPVGSFAANGYGLYDMAGNVWEWCWDWYGAYSSGSQSDPRGPTSSSSRVGRGGGLARYAMYCRSAIRSLSDPLYGVDYLGFRSVLPPGQ
jgi:formylglycine-generating enzyme required for sulfatase activity